MQQWKDQGKEKMVIYSTITLSCPRNESVCVCERDRQTDRQTETETDRQIDRDRQTETQIETETDRQTYILWDLMQTPGGI